ncbi:MAG: hypothetical protein WCI74_02360 [Actinomycetes bacterium]
MTTKSAVVKSVCVGAALLTIGATAACSSSSTSPSASPSTSASSAQPSTTASGTPGSVAMPTEIKAGGNVTATVGEEFFVSTKDVTKITTSNAAVVSVSQPTSTGDPQYNAGAKAESKGTATLEVFVTKAGQPEAVAYKVNVTVK